MQTPSDSSATLPAVATSTLKLEMVTGGKIRPTLSFTTLGVEPDKIDALIETAVATLKTLCERLPTELSEKSLSIDGEVVVQRGQQ